MRFQLNIFVHHIIKQIRFQYLEEVEEAGELTPWWLPLSFDLLLVTLATWPPALAKPGSSFSSPGSFGDLRWPLTRLVSGSVAAEMARLLALLCRPRCLYCRGRISSVVPSTTFEKNNNIYSFAWPLFLIA